MLDFAFAEITQPRRPLPVLHQIIRHVLGEEDVPGITAIHYPLRRVDASPGNIGPTAHVGHLTYRPAVNAHPNGKFRVLPERFGDLERASRGLFRTVTEDQRHPVAGRQPNELLVRGFAHLRGREHDLGELAKPLFLLLDQEFGITHQINEQDMTYLEPKIAVRVRCHKGCVALCG